jgi:outer membrane protein assembly factor BamB
VYFGSCGLIAYDFEGKELWRHLLPVAETNNDFGSGTSPILSDGLVILVRDLKSDSAVLALDAATGKQVWKTARPGMATGYSTPAVWVHDGVKEIVAPGGLAMKAYDLRTGAERWIVRELPAVNCGSPVAGNGMLYFAGWSPAGEDAPMPSFDDMLKADANADGKISESESEKTFLKGFFKANDTDKDGFITRAEWDTMINYLKRGKNRLVAVKPGGSGDITTSHVAWEKTKGLPYVPSPLLYRGELFIIKDGGIASCYDAATGTPKYEQKRLGLDGQFYASPVAANGHIYLMSLAGKVATVLSGEKPDLVWRADFGERIAATPAIVDDTLYLRTESKLFAFKAAK